MEIMVVCNVFSGMEVIWVTLTMAFDQKRSQTAFVLSFLVFISI